MLDFRNTAELIVGFGVGEVVFKFRLPGGVGGKGKAGMVLAVGKELDQLTGHILGGFSGFCLGFLPGVGTNLIQSDGGILAAANVLADKV